MYQRIGLTLVAAVLVALPAGCGTVMNLKAPPTRPINDTPEMFFFPNTCEPFGGVARSLILGGGCAVIGIAVVCEGDWPLALLAPVMVPAGLAILAIDLPLSFAGDLLTYPIVQARQNGEPW